MLNQPPPFLRYREALLMGCAVSLARIKSPERKTL